ncbi:MAG TPA: hypothetical protein VLI93_17230, partial [Acetobacteraceae bacterium]|nr:hypothetical protein [Acetobacteraceae bacterium]
MPVDHAMKRDVAMTKPAAHPQELPVLPSASDLLQLASRPTHVIAHRAWSAARDQILPLVTAGPGLVAVLGPPGSGKTTLLRDLATTLDERGHAACMLDFGDHPIEIGSAAIVLVDEADRMSAARLDELYRRRRVAIVLAALPAFAERLDHHPDLIVIQLTALSPDEACAFVAEQLTQLGLPLSCLTEAAWARLIAHGGGVPRLLVALLKLTLFVAAEEHAERVTGAHVEAAVEVRGGSAVVAKAGPVAVESAIKYDEITEFAPAQGASADARVDRVAEAPRRGYSRVAGGGLIAACLLSAAVLLLRGEPWRNDETASSATPAIVAGTNGPNSPGAQVNETAPAATGPASSVEAPLPVDHKPIAIALAPETPPPEALLSESRSAAFLHSESMAVESPGSRPSVSPSPMSLPPASPLVAPPSPEPLSTEAAPPES